MRVSSLTVERWRNLFGVHIEIPPDATLICLVGENGTGKSTILELLAQCAGTLGLAAGVQLRRPQLGNEPHDISLVFRLPDGFPLEAVEAAVAAHGYGGLTEWDGTLLYRSSNLETNAGAVLGVRAGGITDPGAAQLVGGQLVAALQQRREVNHLHIDADRAFNPAAIQDQEIWGLIRQDLRVPAYARQQASLLTQNMYSEWLKSMLATAVRYEGEYMELALQAQRAGQPVPMPEDPLASYRTALLEVLPHLRFERLDRDQRTLVYDSAGEELRYENLSGGEREIGFLIGQIERFQLRRGLLLLDEPELHLNPELLRTWLAYIKGTMNDGQVWIATHALEAVEAAGLASTFVLERSDDRRVRSVAPLGARPALATLAGAVGSPAFSLARSRFVLIEGDRPGRERQRFAELLDASPSDKFIEVGGCREVIKKLATLQEVAIETDQLRVGGIVDRDLRTDPQVALMESDAGVHVLPCHEVENLFLHPSGIGALLEQAGRPPGEAHAVLKRLADGHAGRWILQRATVAEGWEDVAPAVRHLANQKVWVDIAADIDTSMRELANADSGVDVRTRTRRKAALVAAARFYAALRDDPNELWKRCFGKEVLKGIAPELTLTSADAVESRLLQLWTSGALSRPPETALTSAYVQGIPVLS